MFSTPYSAYVLLLSASYLHHRFPARLVPFLPLFGVPSEIDMGGSIMRFRTMVIVDAFVLLAIALAAWSKPVPSPLDSLLSPPESHSVSGKIAAVAESQFSLDILKNAKPDIVHFVIDENTAVEGKLSVGAHAAVDYRVDGERMIATRVVIVQASGIAAR
jgi:hypothetical protein